MSLFFPAFILSLFTLSIFHWTWEVTSFFHDLCRIQVGNPSTKEIQSAFICGSPLSTKYLKEIFQKTGLIHVVVVSGSHLIFFANLIDPLTRKFPKGKTIASLALLFYSFCTLLDPPVVRAWLQIILSSQKKIYALNWSHEQKIFVSGVCCLIVFPEWVHSYSLIMSWLAALFIAQSSSLFIQSSLCYFGLLPIVAQWAPIHPASIAINTIVGPLFGLIVFPITLLGMALPIAQWIPDLFWSQFIEFLGWINLWVPSIDSFSKNKDPVPIEYYWIYLFLIQGVLTYRHPIEYYFRTKGKS